MSFSFDMAADDAPASVPEETETEASVSVLEVSATESAGVYSPQVLPYTLIFGVVFGLYFIRMMMQFVSSALFVRFKEKEK